MKISQPVGSEAAVPFHPKPIVEGRRVFGEDRREPTLLLAITEMDASNRAWTKLLTSKGLHLTNIPGICYFSGRKP